MFVHRGIKERESDNFGFPIMMTTNCVNNGFANNMDIMKRHFDAQYYPLDIMTFGSSSQYHWHHQNGHYQKIALSNLTTVHVVISAAKKFV